MVIIVMIVVIIIIITTTTTADGLVSAGQAQPSTLTRSCPGRVPDHRRARP
jgi:hypothetical protein